MAEHVKKLQASIGLDDSGLDPKLARLRAVIVQLEAEMQALQGQMRSGSGDSKSLAGTLDVLSAAHAHLTDTATTSAAATDKVHESLASVGKASSSAAKEMMVVGRYADDLQTKTITAAAGLEKLGDATSKSAEEAARLDNFVWEPRGADSELADRDGREPGWSDDRWVRKATEPRAAVAQPNLEDRLAHLAQIEQAGGGMPGRPDNLQSTKAGAGDDPHLRKLQDISKTLDDIRKLYADISMIGVKRRR